PFTIYNYGSAALRIDSIAADRSEFGVDAPQFFPQFVAPKDSLQLTLTFIPKVMGTVSAVVSIDTNDPEDRRFYLHVRGNGVAEGTAILIVAGGIGPPGGMGMVVPIELENSVSVAAMQFDLGFDPNLLSISDVARTFRTGADVMDIFNWGEQIPEVVRVVMTGIGHEITPGKGSVADLVFDVAPDALPGDVALSLSNVIVSDRLANPIPTTTVDGVFIVTGDAALRVVGGSGTPGSAHNRVPVDLYNAVEVAKVQFTLNYDTTSLTLSAVIPTARTEGMSTFRWEQSDSGQVTLSVFDNTGLLIELGRGSIADFYFDVAARISFGEVSLALSDVELYDADHSPIDVVSVDGVFTVDLPDINVPVTFHDYGSVAVGSSADWTLTISNKGRVKLNINSISSDNPDFAIATPFPQTIEPGNALGVIVTFTPSTEGAIEGLLSVGSDDPDEGLISVSLAGYGKRPDIDVSATSHNFGEVVVCSSVDWVTTVSNRGSGDLVIDQVSSEIPDFVVTSPHFPQTIPQDSSIDVTVTFMPWTEGEISGDVIIRSDDSDEPEVILYLTGEGIFGEAALMAVGGMFDRASRDNRVSIKLHNGIAVSAVLFTLGYDPDVLTLTNVTPTERSEVMSIFDWSHTSPDQVSVRISDVSGETVGPGTESVADFYFDVSDNAPLGDAELTLTEVVISDSPGEEIPITVVDGVVTVIGDWATLVVGGGSGGAGSRGNLVPIILDNEMEVYGIQFDLDFDTNVLSVTDVMRTERTDSVEIFNWSSIDEGIRVFVVCFYNDIAPGNGAVVDIIFDVTSNAPPCYFPLILSNVEFYDCPVCLAPPTPFSTSNGGFTRSTPTLGVQLASFDATWQRGFVVLGWATSTETDLVGFNLYRSSSDAEFEKINTEGLITGSSPYSYIDRSIGQEGTYHYKLGALCSNGQEKIVGTTSVEVTELFPQQYALFQNYPNPFNPTTTIRYAIPSREQRAWSEEQRAESREVSSVSELSALRTTLKVYNILGQEVKTLVNEQLEPGEYSVNWDGRDNSGMNLPSGIYLYRLKAGNYVSTKRMILLK
ncbi:MAG: choice-of-anchor D domain-containing protein, partial [bacterium]